MTVALVGCQDRQLVDRVCGILATAGMETVRASGVAVREQLRLGQWGVVLLGWELGENVLALEVLAESKRLLPEVPVLVLSPYPDLAYARRATTLGAFDYIEVPFTSVRLLEAVRASLPEGETHDPLVASIRCEFVAESRAALQIVRQIARYAQQPDCDVLLTGETGTGKEVAAHAIHAASARKDAPFVAENCANLQGLDVSELFGHEKGSFTGAVVDHHGAFERTGQGTLFLDEVQELTLDTQAQLLRVVEKREFRRVGGEESLLFSGRILYATNQDIQEAVRRGAFREDLYHRIKTYQVHIPPLRERKEDIVPLAEHFLRKLDPDGPVGLSMPVIVLLNDYHFPGNVRELRNVIADARMRCVGPELLARHVLPRLDAETIESASDEQQAAKQGLYQLALKDAVARMEQEYCRNYLPWILQACNNNLTQAALKAGVDPKTFRRKWEECGLPKLSTR